LNLAIADQWCDALESDQFSQGFNRLCDPSDPSNPRHCCLGVLCELAVKAGVIESRHGISFYGYPSKIFGKEVYYLPKPVMEWAGITNTEEMYDLSKMNDNKRDFKAIAAHIRANAGKL
jgi:hypothetical protein